MVFSSMIFLCIFLPVTFGLHLLLPGMRAKNMLLVIASLLFYAYGEPVYVLLLIGSSFFNYLFAWLVERDPGHKKVWVVAAVLANLAVLIIFEYTGFNQVHLILLQVRQFQYRRYVCLSVFHFLLSRHCLM